MRLDPWLGQAGQLDVGELKMGRILRDVPPEPDFERGGAVPQLVEPGASRTVEPRPLQLERLQLDCHIAPNLGVRSLKLDSGNRDLIVTIGIDTMLHRFGALVTLLPGTADRGVRVEVEHEVGELTGAEQVITRVIPAAKRIRRGTPAGDREHGGKLGVARVKLRVHHADQAGGVQGRRVEGGGRHRRLGQENGGGERERREDRQAAAKHGSSRNHGEAFKEHPRVPAKARPIHGVTRYRTAIPSSL